MDHVRVGTAALYDRLYEYLNEWALNLALNPRGLTTPIRVEPSTINGRNGDRSGVQLLFLPTATGKNYKSREEERELEGRSGGSVKATAMKSRVARKVALKWWWRLPTKALFV